MRPADPRLLRYAQAARRYLVVTVVLGLAGTALILAQAGLLAHALAAAARGGAAAAALSGTLLSLLGVVAARAAVAYGGEAAALRAAADVKSQLRRALAARTLGLGPGWAGDQQAGEIAALATRGLDGLDAYFARYLPQLVLAVAVPAAVLARVAAADWISAVVIAVTLPLIPVFAVLVGWHTRARTRRQWRLLATLAGHFLDVVEGLPTLKVFGRGQGAGRGDTRGDGRVPGRHHVRAAGGVPVRPGARAVRRDRHRAGRGRGGAAAALRPPGVRDGAAGAAADPGGVPAAAGGRRPVPRQHGGGRRGRSRYGDPRNAGAGPAAAS